jgi:hypothetical protein
VSYGVFFRLIVSGDPAESARGILTHERLFRIGIAGGVFNGVAIVVLITALYVVLSPVSPGLALVAAFSRLIQCFTWLLLMVNHFIALGMLRDANYTRAFGPDRVPLLAQLYLNGWDTYYVGLLFWSVAVLVGSWLWFMSNYIPRVLAAAGVISSAWCIACTVVFYVFPEFPNVVSGWLFDSPMVLFEITLSVWLLIKGVDIKQ